MSSAFSAITFTPNVKAQQSQMGSRSAYAAHEQSCVNEGGSRPSCEAGFIAARDSSISARWANRDGPMCSIAADPPVSQSALTRTRLGFADYTGNRRYISTGNIAGDNRVSLCLMDYPEPDATDDSSAGRRSLPRKAT